jgi:hypothetical protein
MIKMLESKVTVIEYLKVKLIGSKGKTYKRKSL